MQIGQDGRQPGHEHGKPFHFSDAAGSGRRDGSRGYECLHPVYEFPQRRSPRAGCNRGQRRQQDRSKPQDFYFRRRVNTAQTGCCSPPVSSRTWFFLCNCTAENSSFPAGQQRPPSSSGTRSMFSGTADFPPVSSGSTDRSGSGHAPTVHRSEDPVSGARTSCPCRCRAY